MIMDKTFLKGALCMLILFAYLIGTVNGIGYSIYIGQWPTAISVAVLAVLAFPVVRNIFKEPPSTSVSTVYTLSLSALSVR